MGTWFQTITAPPGICQLAQFTSIDLEYEKLLGIMFSPSFLSTLLFLCSKSF